MAAAEIPRLREQARIDRKREQVACRSSVHPEKCRLNNIINI